MTCRRPLYGCEVSPPLLLTWHGLVARLARASFLMHTASHLSADTEKKALWAASHRLRAGLCRQTGISLKGFFIPGVRCPWAQLPPERTREPRRRCMRQRWECESTRAARGANAISPKSG